MGVRNCRAMKVTVWVCLSVIPLSSCFVRKRVVSLPGNRPSGPLLTATAVELIQRVHNIADPIQSFELRMDMSPSVGNLYQKGKIKDYATLGGVHSLSEARQDPNCWAGTHGRYHRV